MRKAEKMYTRVMYNKPHWPCHNHCRVYERSERLEDDLVNILFSIVERHPNDRNQLIPQHSHYSKSKHYKYTLILYFSYKKKKRL